MDGLILREHDDALLAEVNDRERTAAWNHCCNGLVRKVMVNLVFGPEDDEGNLRDTIAWSARETKLRDEQRRPSWKTVVVSQCMACLS